MAAMNPYLFGREIQELCDCNARCWRVFDVDFDSDETFHRTYSFCPMCKPERLENYLVPVTRYYRP